MMMMTSFLLIKTIFVFNTGIDYCLQMQINCKLFK